MGKIRILIGGFVLGMTLFNLTGCIVAEPRDGYYDHDHHRWYHEHRWRECREHDEHCY